MPPQSPPPPAPPFFVLASGSPRRREFMELLGLPFTVLTPPAAGSQAVDETPLPGETPPALVQRLSRIKARAVVDMLPLFGPDPLTAKGLAIVVAADTVVVLAGQILGKPSGPAEAGQMLKQLRQQPHYVYSGLTVIAAGWETGQAHISKSITRLHQSKVWMRPYTNAEIAAYVASGDPLDKAGAYGIQNKSFAPVARLEGCFASVMGFPLGELAAALKEINISLPPVARLCAQHTHHPCCQE
ncbi:MAG: septum formation protein Maf [Anaerolineae bacterium]|nr:septum formation protein Maf [Anaerolineae bacterium]